MIKIFLLLFSAWSTFSFAGSIGFTIQFTPDHVQLKNIGNEGAHRLTVFTLQDDQHWHALKVVAGDASYVMPQQQLDTVRVQAKTASILKTLDPVLVLFNDQSGNAMTQLAWRKAPAQANITLRYERQGTRLIVYPPNSDAAAHIFKTHVILVPYPGIAALAQPLKAIAIPPPTVRHDWSTVPPAPAAPLTVETGEGMSGAWLLHESPNGALSLQVITDGKQRGAEQIPVWLLAVRQSGWLAASWLFFLGLLTLAGGWWLGKRQAVTSPKAS